MPAAIGAAIFAVIAPTAVSATIAGVSLASIVGGVVLTVAAGVLQYLLAPKPPVPKPQAGFFPLRQSIPPRITGYGEARLAGAYMYYEVLDSNSWDVLAIHHGRIQEITRYYLHDDVVTLNPNGSIASSSQDHNYHADYPVPQVTILSRIGLSTETPYAELVSAAAAAGAKHGKAPSWTTAHRGDGIASILLRCLSRNAKHFAEDYPRGLHTPSVAARLSYIYDPRQPGHTQSDKSTYQWSANPVLAIADYVTDADHGMGLDWSECFGDATQLSDEADICDEPIGKKAGGTEPRYSLGGVFQHDNAPSDVLATMLSTCDGWLAETGDGSLRLLSGKYRAPTVTFRDNHLRGYTVQNGVADEDIINELIPVYTSRDHQFASVEGQPWRDEDDISERGKVRSENLDLKWVQSHSQGRRLCKREMARQTSRLRGTLITTLYGLVGLGERWIKLEVEDHEDLADLVVEIVSSPTVDFMQRTVTFEWRSVNPNSIDAWDPDIEEGTPPPVPVVNSEDTTSAPSDINVTVEGRDGAAVYADVSFTAVEDDDRSTTYSIDLRVASSSSGAWATTEYTFDQAEVTSGRVFLSIQNLSPNTNYELRILRQRGSSQSSGYSAIVPFETTHVAPSSPDSFIFDAPTGKLSWRAPSSSSFVTTRVFAAALGANFSDAVIVSPTPAGVPGSAGVVQTFTPTGRTVDKSYWIAAENASGQRSTPTGPVTVPADIAPDAPASPEATVSGLNVTYSVRAPNSASTAKLKYYRAPFGGTFGSSTLLTSLNATPNQVIEIVDTPGAGRWVYFATAATIGDTESSPIGPTPATVGSFALREDGTFALREDGGRTFREAA